MSTAVPPLPTWFGPSLATRFSSFGVYTVRSVEVGEGTSVTFVPVPDLLDHPSTFEICT